MSRELPPCDHDECPPTHCKQPGAFDMDAEWECEHCKRKVRFGDTALSWCLNIICDDCHEKERDSENAKLTHKGGKDYEI